MVDSPYGVTDVLFDFDIVAFVYSVEQATWQFALVFLSEWFEPAY